MSPNSNPQSVVTLRLCADFQRLVLRNEARAMALVTEADRLEDAQARTENAVDRSELRMLAEVELDVMSDSVRVAVVLDSGVGVVRFARIRNGALRASMLP